MYDDTTINVGRKAGTEIGSNSTSEGNSTTASGASSHAEGSETIAAGYCSHAEGEGSSADSACQHVEGKYNISDVSHKYAHIIGNGNSDRERSNAHTVDWEGNAWYSGDVCNGNGVSLDGLNTNMSDVWNSSVTYGVNSYCIYSNKLWKCKVQHKNQPPTEGTYWTACTISGEISELNSNLEILNYNVPRIVPKDITPYFTDGTLWNRIAGTNGYREYEDIHVGDYIDMGRTVTCPNIQGDTYGTVGSRYVTVASCGGLKGGGASAFTKNHLVMIPGQGFGGTQHFGRHRMNPSNTTEGGYVASQMFTDILGAVVSSGSIESGATINQQLYYIFGSHLQTTNELLSNAMTSTLNNRFGSANGAASGWAWNNVQACLMSEIEVYGSSVWSSSGYDTGNANHQLELFRFSKNAVNNITAYYWLKDIASASDFCRCLYGSSYYSGAGDTGVYVRPRFVIA